MSAAQNAAGPEFEVYFPEVSFPMITAISILILAIALFLIIAVLLQSSKNHRMSGVVTGGAETFFGKQKGKTIDAKLSKLTAVLAAIFAIVVLALYLINAHNVAKQNSADVTSSDDYEYITADDLLGDADLTADEDGATEDGATEDGATEDGETEDGAEAEDAKEESATE